MTTEARLDRDSSVTDRIRQAAVEYWPAAVLTAILMVGAYLRFSGLNWDDFSHLHPDERFLTQVLTALRPSEGLKNYFDTAQSALNPANVGHRFFVYGTLPIFIVRFLGEWLGRTTYDEIHLVGRAASASFDLVSIVLTYAIGARLYRRRVGLLAAAFAAVTVILIQHSHFFVVDPFANTFILAGIYMAVRILDRGTYAEFAFFGVMLGAAVASKISAAPLAGVAALAVAIRYARSERTEQPQVLRRGTGGLILAALLSLVTFRIFQPYAFAGPSIFGIFPSEAWLGTMAEIRRQTSGIVDFPPALQWADRAPILFSLRNMVLWGFGLPLGLAAWGSWLWALTQTVRGRDWHRHLIPVAWTGLYFVWQSVNFTKAMRYQMPVYPTLAILAAWGLWELWDRARGMERASSWRRPAMVASALAGILVLVVTSAYAYGFSGIYRRPLTRVEASQWIYAQVPSAVNLILEDDTGRVLEPLGVQLELILAPGQPREFTFHVNRPGLADRILTPFISRVTGTGDLDLMFSLHVPESPEPLAIARITTPLAAGGETRLELDLDRTVEVQPGRDYLIRAVALGQDGAALRGDLALLSGDVSADPFVILRVPELATPLAPDIPRTYAFNSHKSGIATGVLLPYVSPVGTDPDAPLVAVELHHAGQQAILARGALRPSLEPGSENQVVVAFAEPVGIEQDAAYELRLSASGGSALALRTSVVISETSWDDGLPINVDGYSKAGRYHDVNQEMYWPDDQDSDADGLSDKYERIQRTLTEGDYLFISSNRQYGTVGRVPVRYPVSTAYYRALFNCPEPQPVWYCADNAEIGQAGRELGYELLAIFDSNPAMFGIEVSDQGAEESFTVYDHPQVLIFKKTEAYRPEMVAEELGGISVSNVQNLPPSELQATERPLLLLPEVRWDQVRQNGTWRSLFPAGNALNRSPLLAVAVWWLTIAAAGWVVLPLLCIAFPGLQDRGYAIARLGGLLLVGWLWWISGSLAVSTSRTVLVLILLGLALLSGWLVWRDRQDWMRFFRDNVSEIILIEALMAGFFLLDLGIRYGNPDLWHPSKGGEKPMDLSYLTAVLKSPSFPPYDPWFAGGYINYYYFGFVLIGWPIKLLGIETTLAYNLALPTLFAVLAGACYSAGYHLVSPWRDEFNHSRWWPRFAGLAAATGVVLIGNLGTVRMLYEAFQAVGSDGGSGLGIIGDAWRALRGFVRVTAGGADLPVPLDHWYWNPSRAIAPGPGEAGPITEFPFFTFLYADLHAHLISLPLTVGALVWSLSWLRWLRKAATAPLARGLAAIAAGALIIGALRPTNTWDFPVYLGLGILAAIAGCYLGQGARGLPRGLLWAGSLVGLSLLLYAPYAAWYELGYTRPELWTGSKSPLMDYLTVHGVFLFILVGWFTWETREWLAASPLVGLHRARGSAPFIALLGAAVILGTIVMASVGYGISPLTIPLVLWAAALFARPGQAAGKRAALVMTAAALALTYTVEVVRLEGDISRMNTVFKFYLQVWVLLAISAAAALAWVVSDMGRWWPWLRSTWSAAAAVLIMGGLLYPLTATPAKVRDRWSPTAPKTLRGMEYMNHVTRFEQGETFELQEDYAAIEWLRDNVEGTKVIVEANVAPYRWGSRMTIYTGLPGVLGWDWHQQQQRVVMPGDPIAERRSDITELYTSRSTVRAWEILQRYQVDYVIVGQLERAIYETVEPCWASGEAGQGVMCDLAGLPVGMTAPPVAASACQPLDPNADPVTLTCPTGGLEKFEQMVSGGQLALVFQQGGTTIYEVLR